MISKSSPRDRYRRIRLLGEGGAGRVWLAEDLWRGGAPVALKEPVAATADTEPAVRREFATLASLRHPSLVEALDFESEVGERGGPRFSLEFVEGADIVATIRREGAPAFAPLAAEALRALALLHDFGVIHRDVKPANLLVRAAPRRGARVVLLDFGLAAPGGAEKRVRAGMAGTLPYLAPELFEGGDATRRTDLYALGAVLFEAVHGRPPIALKGNDTTAFVAAVREGRRSRPPLPPGFPSRLGPWLDAMLSLDPAGRPADGTEALAQLSEVYGASLPAETPETRSSRLESGAPPGRSAEEAALWAHVAPSDAPRVVWLAGGAGSGKSRMLRWLAAEGVGRGYDVFAPPPGADLPAALERLRETAAARPVLVLLDEIEASGAGAVEFLERVAREPKAPPLRVVAAVRPGEIRIPALRKLLGDTGTVPTLRRVDLEPLGAPGLHAMAERATGRAPSDARLKWLVEATEGNALLAATYLAEGVWEKGGRERRAVALEASIADRIARLSPEARRWLEAVAVAGPLLEVGPLAGLAQLDLESQTDAGEIVARSALARPIHGRWHTETRLVSQITIRLMEAGSRRALHRRVAEHLESAPGAPDSDAMARLWSEAGDGERAAEWGVRAGDAAAARNRPADAAERYRAALRNLPRRSALRLTIRLKQGESLLAAGFCDAAARAFGAARRLARTEDGRVRAAVRQGHAIVRTSSFARMVATGRALAEQAARLGDDLLAIEARLIPAIALARQSPRSDAIDEFRSCVEAARGRDLAAEAAATAALATALLNASDPECASVLYRAAELQRRAGDRTGLVKSLVALGKQLRVSGHLAEARDLIEEARRIANESGNLAMLVYLSLRLLAIYQFAEQFDRAVAAGREALDQSLHLGDDVLILSSRTHLASALNEVGRPAESIALLQDALSEDIGRADPISSTVARAQFANALFLAEPGRAAAAASVLRPALDAARSRLDPRTHALVLSIEIARRATANPAENDSDLRTEFATLLEQHGAQVDDEVRYWCTRAFAQASLQAGRIDEVLESATEALDLATKNDWPGKAAVGAFLLAEANRARGDVAASMDHGERASRFVAVASSRIDDPAMRADFLDQPLMRAIRDRREAASGERRLTALYDMIRTLNSQTDPELLLESILDMALRAVGAERGMILLTEPSGASFSIRLVRNLEPETAADAEQFSRSIVAQAGAGQSVLALDAGHDERFRDLKSISLYRIRSLMCVPLRSRGAIVGTVYLDSRREGRLFSQEDLRFVEAFSDHAALALENARARAELERENRRLRAVAGERASYGAIIGRSAVIQRMFDLLDTITQSELPVLIQGESGTGKELVAKAIHFNGPRKAKHFLTENCAAIPESLLESELFGHVRGAFTGAERDRAGLFEHADGGTLFLDEVGDMSPGMQARLLRVLQEGEIRRVGGDHVIHVNVRVIAATNKDLAAAVEGGRFREDLYYRLNVLTVNLPPLRARTGDVGLIAGHLIERISRERGRPVPRIDSAVLDLLERYEWPGNVRQLENTIQRLALLAGSGPITPELVDGDEQLRRMLRGAPPAIPVLSLEKSEREQIRRALDETSGNRDRAARILGISRATIYRKIKEYGLR